jgi:hypothetical protein
MKLVQKGGLCDDLPFFYVFDVFDVFEEQK